MSVDTEWLVDFFRRQARLGFEEGDYTRTRNCCGELLRQLPKDREAWQLLGEAALASHDSVTALRAFDQLLELEPQNVDYAMKLGQASLQAQDWPAAIFSARKRPAYPCALTRRGMVDPRLPLWLKKFWTAIASLWPRAAAVN